MRSERGSGEVFIFFMMFLALWGLLLIFFMLILSPSYDSKEKCLEEWSKCDRVTEIWEPTNNAEEK